MFPPVKSAVVNSMAYSQKEMSLCTDIVIHHQNIIL